MLQVGKTYHHSESGRKNAWKIVEQWGDNLFEGEHVGSTSPNSRVMFDKSGRPVGAKGKRTYNPSGWRLVEAKQYEYIVLYGDDSISRQWYPVEHSTPTYPETMYVMRERKRNETCRIMTHRELNYFIKENL